MLENLPDNKDEINDGQEKHLVSKGKEEVKSVFNKKIIIKGSLWFALITIATIAGIFFYNNTGNTVKALSHISYKYIAICFVMLFVDLMLGSWRNHIFIRKLNP